MKIVFLRHGESMGNVWGGAYTDDRTNFLSLKGVKQAELASYDIQDRMDDIDIVYMSELTRARQTAITVMQTAGNWKRKYELDARLNEWSWDGPASPKWYTREKSIDFWNRVVDFWDEDIFPYWDDDVNLFITSHYYTMQASFEIIKDHFGMDNNVGQDLDPRAHGGIPNSVPFYFDTEKKELPQILLSGYKNR